MEIGGLFGLLIFVDIVAVDCWELDRAEARRRCSTNSTVESVDVSHVTDFLASQTLAVLFNLPPAMYVHHSFIPSFLHSFLPVSKTLLDSCRLLNYCFRSWPDYFPDCTAVSTTRPDSCRLLDYCLVRETDRELDRWHLLHWYVLQHINQEKIKTINLLLHITTIIDELSGPWIHSLII